MIRAVKIILLGTCLLIVAAYGTGIVSLAASPAAMGANDFARGASSGWTALRSPTHFRRHRRGTIPFWAPFQQPRAWLLPSAVPTGVRPMVPLPTTTCSSGRLPVARIPEPVR